MRCFINQVFNENRVIVMLKSASGGRVGVMACGLEGVNVWFPLNNFSLLWPIDTKLAVWIAFIKRQLGIATQVSVIKVKVTVTKIRNSVSVQLLLFALAYYCCMGSLHQDAAWDCY